MYRAGTRRANPAPDAAAARDVDDARCWRLAAAGGLRVPAVPGASRAVVGERFAALPDPFTPLLDLWTSGHALDALSPEAPRGLAPVAPPGTAVPAEPR